MARGYSIRISDVSKCFGTQEVLSGVNLTINEGDFVAIVGKSGCGKSTLLRLISNLETLTAGSIEITGEGADQKNNGIKFLFQEARLLPWKKVWKNIALVSQDKSKEAALQVLRSVKLEEKADEWPEILSGGQKQRVSLARAISSNPKLLLLDEPLSALDALTRIEMQVLLQTLWQENGFTVVLVTHDVSEAVYLADKVILIEEGKITMEEPITLARPRERDASFAYFEEKILNRVMNYEKIDRSSAELFMI